MIGELSQEWLAINKREERYRQDAMYHSPIYDALPRVSIKGEEVYVFQLPHLKQHLIEVRRDSRFTTVPKHIRSHLNMNYIYSGSCVYHVNGTTFQLQAGDVCIVDRNVLLEKERLGEEDIIFNISLSHDFFSRDFISRLGEASVLSEFLFSSLTENNAHDGYLIFQNSHPFVETYLIQLLNEYLSYETFSQSSMEALLTLIFIQLIRDYQADTTKSVVHISHRDHHLLEIIEYIEKNAKSTSLEEVAKVFNYHPKYLSQLIKKTWKKSFKQIQTEQRLKNAAQLLRYSQMSVMQIADEVGMGNMNQFYKKFEEAYHQTPKAFRLHYKSD